MQYCVQQLCTVQCTHMNRPNSSVDWVLSHWAHFNVLRFIFQKPAASGSLQIQDAKNRHLGTIAQLCRAISSQLRHVSTIGKKNLLSTISPPRLHNMVNFGPLAAEIDLVVWGPHANFNGFRVLAALLYGM